MRENVSLSTCRLSLDHDPIRLPTRRFILRRPDYEDKFDFTTLYNDIFWSSDNSRIILVGPPHLNLFVDGLIHYVALPSGDECESRTFHHQWTDRVEIIPPAGTTGLVVICRNSRFYISPQPSMAGLFMDKNAIFTMSRNNCLYWIHDWALFYSRMHGCNAVLFYDNMSDQYGLDDIYEALRAALPEGMIVVIDWSFRYGVFDGRKDKTIGLWDGFFSQFTIFEHARWRFLGEARAVINADIDELALCTSGESLFDLTKASASGYLRYSGDWISGHTASIDNKLSFKDYFFRTGGGADVTEKKWSLDPSKCPPTSQWKVHCVEGLYEGEESLKVRLRHFKAINTNWDIDTHLSSSLRTELTSEELKNLAVDEQLIHALSTCFASGNPQLKPVSQRESSIRAHALRIKAGQLWRGKRINMAMHCAREASKLLPEHPGFKLFLSELLKVTGQFAEARVLEVEVQELIDQDASSHFLRGRMLSGQLDFGRAIDELCLALKLNPFLIDPYEHLADLFIIQGLDQDARDLVCQAPLLDHEFDEPAELRLSLLFERIGDLESAVSFVQSALERFPSAHGYHQLGRLYGRLGRRKEAELALNNALAYSQQDSRFDQDPGVSNYCVHERFWDASLPAIFIDLGRLYLEQERYSRAVELFQRCIDLSPLTVEALLLMSRAYALSGHPERSRQASERYAILAEAIIAYDFVDGKPGVSRTTDPFLQLWRRGDLYLQRIRQLSDASSLSDACVQAYALAANREVLPTANLAAIHVLFREGHHQQAESLLGDFVDTYGELWITHSLRSMFEMAKGNNEVSLRSIDLSIALYPASPLLFVQRSKALIALNRHDEALAAVEQGLKLNPRMVEFHHQCCNLYLLQDDVQRALEAANEAVALDPSNSYSRNCLSRAQLALGLPDAALVSAQGAIRLDPSRALHHIQLSKVLRASMSLTQAIAAADEAVILEPENASFKLFRITTVLQAGLQQQALSLIHDALEQHPDCAELYVHLANLSIFRGCYPEAEQASRKAILLQPTFCAAYLTLSRAITAPSRSQEAIDALQELFRLSTLEHERASAFLRLGAIYLEIADFKCAVDSASQSIALVSSLAPAHHLLGRGLVQLGELDQALVAFNRAIALAPEQAAWFLQRSHLHMRLNRVMEALESVNQALKLDPELRHAVAHRDAILKRLEALQETTVDQKPPSKGLTAL